MAHHVPSERHMTYPLATSAPRWTARNATPWRFVRANSGRTVSAVTRPVARRAKPTAPTATCIPPPAAPAHGETLGVEMATRRAAFQQAGLDVGDLDPDPVVQWRRWHAAAAEAGCVEPDAAALATVDAEG